MSLHASHGDGNGIFRFGAYGLGLYTVSWGITSNMMCLDSLYTVQTCASSLGFYVFFVDLLCINWGQ